MRDDDILIREVLDLKRQAIFMYANNCHIGTIGVIKGMAVQVYFN